MNLSWRQKGWLVFAVLACLTVRAFLRLQQQGSDGPFSNESPEAPPIPPTMEEGVPLLHTLATTTTALNYTLSTSRDALPSSRGALSASTGSSEPDWAETGKQKRKWVKRGKKRPTGGTSEGELSSDRESRDDKTRKPDALESRQMRSFTSMAKMFEASGHEGVPDRKPRDRKWVKRGRRKPARTPEEMREPSMPPPDVEGVARAMPEVAPKRGE